VNVILGVSLKTYFGYQQTLDWAVAVRRLLAKSSPRNIELFVLPSFPTLPAVAEILAGTGIAVGAQNLCADDAGNRTGEVNGAMLAEIGCRYAETGHAERRTLFGETDAVVAAKTATALRHGLTPVLCLGEIEPASTGAAVEEGVRQLAAALPGPVTGRVLAAYEPRWAIGAAEPASDDHIVGVVAGLKSELRRRASNSAVIYGGSAGPGLLSRLADAVDGLFLGRFAHDPYALAAVIAEADSLTGQPQEVLR
jgi:triosephosphate isomerase